MGFESCGCSRYKEKKKAPRYRRAVEIMWCDVQYVEVQGQRWCTSHSSVPCPVLLQIKSSMLWRRASGKRRAEEGRGDGGQQGEQGSV